ncbi:type II secretion system F family protein [Pseudobacteroides cellulosolvens]|uniref:Type II secretion system F domain-containing protein n=1 Tax=Pseudobacteroides cellulosolvens ATCC 35603 = DSM 2933 TaxID=398512 RepID=A0A0L6JJA3_9FIRM|nr:type II secretion system F family protein [Pseudobacteroides cellulosolvens]KNY25815.1 Type II secretion system F domain-containing protein [Pseudobacteroides cellulosolvens ATCC 35603 = DSM 2933]
MDNIQTKNAGSVQSFRYRAVDHTGKTIKGRIKAQDIDEAKVKIKDNDLIPIKVDSDISVYSKMNRGFTKKVDLSTVSIFCTQLYSIISSGVNILRGIEILGKQNKNKLMQDIVSSIISEVQKGKSLSEAMDNDQCPLPKLLVNMVAVGEVSGNLDEILRQMAIYYEKENFMRQKLKGAMIYPVILTVVGVGMLIFFSTFVLPEITGVLLDSGQKLPVLTTMVLGSIDAVKKYGIIVAAAIILMVVLIRVLVPKEKFRAAKDKFLIKAPLLNVCIQNMVTTRFLRSMYIMLNGGITLIAVLESVEKTLGNTIAEDAIRTCMEGVKRGEKLSENLAGSNFFDPLVINMIEVGEETGQLENVLQKMTDFFDKETDAVLNRLLSSLEPIFTIIIGIFISILIISLMLPMFGMISNFKSG